MRPLRLRYSFARIVELRKRFACLILAFGTVFACGLGVETLGQDRVIRISYGKIADLSQLTHSGQSVQTVLKQLELVPQGEILPFVDLEGEFLALKRKEEALFARQKSVRTRYEQGRISFEAAQAYVDEIKARHSLLKLEFEQLKTRAASFRISEGRRQLQALVEPFLEPYAFLLEDALETSGISKAERPLIDVGTLFPQGEPQPAWADLLRTRRFHVLSDGEGFARVFVPGEKARDGYDKNYSALRLVLNWLMRSSGPQLKVEVFAYQNDLPTQTLSLNTVPLTFTLTSPLPIPTNGGSA